MTNSSILDTFPLGLHWPTDDPFLFCAHHDDAYPAGNEQLGPAASLAGRRIGMDFEGKDGWRMYHGDVVPGFPQHPHRGFETVTLVRRGLIDHSDSLGATARFGRGDVQWLTAGQGIVHSEMFPLLDPTNPNPLELFQIWLNLPSSSKMVPAYFSMLWADTIPEHVATDEAGKQTRIALIAGALGELKPPAPPPDSWASRPEADVAVWTLSLEPGARFRLPAGPPTSNRNLYFFDGETLRLDGTQVEAGHGLRIAADAEPLLENTGGPAELLLLQGRPIGEPVAHYGPFVMNTRAELEQAITDYRRTGFGGWPWPSDGPVHARGAGRFAKHADGRVEYADPAASGNDPAVRGVV